MKTLLKLFFKQLLISLIFSSVYALLFEQTFNIFVIKLDWNSNTKDIFEGGCIFDLIVQFTYITCEVLHSNFIVLFSAVFMRCCLSKL